MGHNTSDRAGSSRSDAGVNLPAATKPLKKNSRGKRKRLESVSFIPFSTPFRPKSEAPRVPTVEEACEEAKGRGLVDADTSQAKYLMDRIGYRHVEMYFPVYAVDGGLEDGISLREVHRMMRFDRKLQALLMEYIGLFELRFRAQYSYVMGRERGPFAHRNPKNYKNREYFDGFIAEYSREFERQIKSKNKPVIEAYRMYGDAPLPLAVEIMSFGTLSKLYRNTRSAKVRDSVAGSFGVEQDVLVSWSRAISSVRNQCAHFGVVACRKLTSRPKMIAGVKCDNGHPFYLMLVLAKLLCYGNENYSDDPTLSYGLAYVNDSVNLLQAEEDLALKVGFPSTWYEILTSPEITGTPSWHFKNRPDDPSARMRIQVYTGGDGGIMTVKS